MHLLDYLYYLFILSNTQIIYNINVLYLTQPRINTLSAFENTL